MMKKTFCIIILLAAISLSEDDSHFCFSFVTPPLILTGISWASFDTKIDSGDAVPFDNDITMKAVSLSTGFTLNYSNDSFSSQLSTIIPIGDIFGGGEDVGYEAWFWGLCPSISFPLINLDTFKLVLNGDYRLNYFIKRRYTEPKGLFDEVYQYAGFGITFAFIDYYTESEISHHNSVIISQELGCSWAGGLTGISSIKYQGTGMFESLDKNVNNNAFAYPTIGVEAIYSSTYFYIRYFIEFGWVF